MQTNLSFLCYELKSESDFAMEYPDAHVGTIVEFFSASSNLNVITSFFIVSYPDVFVVEVVYFFN